MASDIMSIQRQACMPWKVWRGERLMIIRLKGEFGVSELKTDEAGGVTDDELAWAYEI